MAALAVGHRPAARLRPGAPALAATIAVAPGIPPDINADGLCALIEAIDNANADAQTHSDCVAGNGADTIVLPIGSTFQTASGASILTR